ncbi:hypothetical protein [uncultured Mediterranean phage uvMED]|nr:hypothetical protein [uncultured Mediterranean phage uvMED]BAQ91488.1 hypothetical protein [uncultured Mediterranean phage uvMED]BAQ91521.1 hypothetical protein [uncultured Mediterranean phage uvMED]
MGLVIMSKELGRKDQDDILKVTQREYQEKKNIVVRVVSIIIILLFTGCTTKDINLDPISTVANQLIKVIKDKK